MKLHFILLLLLVFKLTCYSQKHEFSFELHAGLPVENLMPFVATGSTHFEHKKLNSYSIFSLNANYQYEMLSKINLYLGIGLGYSKTTNTLPFYSSGDYVFLLENIKVPFHLLNISALSISQKTRLNSKLFLNCKITFNVRKSLIRNQFISSDFKFNTTDWIEYKYEYRILDQYEGFSIIPNFQFEIEKKIKKGKLKYGFRLERRLQYLYEGNSSFNFYINGSSFPTQQIDRTSHLENQSFTYITLSLGYIFERKTHNTVYME